MTTSQPPPPNLRWKTYGERSLYDSPWVRLMMAEVESPDGVRFYHHVVRLRPIAIALVVDDRDRVLTQWRYRFATGQWGYELIGGIVEKGEQAAETAAREITEETGYEAIGEPDYLVSFQPLPGIVDARVDAFLWRQVEKVGEPTDTEEAARIEWIPIDRMLELVQRSEVLGSGAIIPLLLYLLTRRSG